MALDRPKPVAPPATEVAPKAKQLASANSPAKPAPKPAEKNEASDTPPISAPKAKQVAVARATPEPPAEAVQEPDPKPSRPAEVKKKVVEAKAEKKPAEPKVPVPATGAWRIQLGAFAQKSNAEAMFKKLSGKDALDGRRPFYIPAGAVTRLQVGPFESQKSASSACRAVGVACFPVNSK
jgi:cell division protein FtsN